LFSPETADGNFIEEVTTEGQRAHCHTPGPSTHPIALAFRHVYPHGLNVLQR